MSEKQQSTGDTDAIRIENARVGYQSAIDLWIYQGDAVWTRFNVMLVANSIIIAVIGLAITSQRSLPLLTVVLPIVGLILCVAWFLLMKRANDYQTYYIQSARELEEQYLSNSVKTVSRGGSFAKGDEVTLQIDGKPKPLQMSVLPWLKSEWVSYVVIIVFAVMYIVTFFQN